jgi:hypothetical protein
VRFIDDSEDWPVDGSLRLGDLLWLQGGSCEGFGKMVVWAASLSPSDWTSTVIAARPARSKVKREGGMMRRDFHEWQILTKIT